MPIILNNFWPIISMLILLAIEAFFSASETALFNLPSRQISAMSQSRNRIRLIVADLLKNPKNLLSTILLGDMAVSTLYFSISGVLVLSVNQENNTIAAAAAAATAFAAFVIFGELLPKSLAYSNSQPIALAVALPCFFCQKILSPIHHFLNIAIVEPTLLIILGKHRHPQPISLKQLKMLIESSRQRGLITADENQLLGEVIELGLLKVRQVMRPRVDILAASDSASNSQVRDMMTNRHLTKLPIYSGKIDNIIGMADLRQLILHPDTPPIRLAYKPDFVPQQKTVESLLEFFRTAKKDTAIVVDEYGGLAGIVSLEDIVEELVGPIEHIDGIEPVKQLGPMTYRLAGNLAIHDWADAFGIDVGESRIATIGGLIVALLGKIPHAGDVAFLKNLKFTVELVRKHRIESVVLEMMPIESSKKAKQSK